MKVGIDVVISGELGYVTQAVAATESSLQVHFQDLVQRHGRLGRLQFRLADGGMRLEHVVNESPDWNIGQVRASHSQSELAFALQNSSSGNFHNFIRILLEFHTTSTIL